MTSVEVRSGKVDIEVPSDEDAKQCARLLKDPKSKLQSLKLRKGLVTSNGAAAIAKALKENSSLRHLGLPSNNIGDVGVAAIGRAVEGATGCALVSLDLAETGITFVGLSTLVQGLSSLPNLHTICLADNNLGKEAGVQFANLLKASTSVHTILAGGNYLGDRGVAALCGAFCYLKPARVLSLDVSRNGVGDLGAQWLCKGISALCRNRDDISGGGGVRDLRLGGNNLTYTGAKELARLFSEDRCARELRELDVSLNTITADGFKPLTASLHGCPELVRLDAAGCRLGPGGVEAAADLIAAAGPKLRVVVLTPKAEFADRVLGDRGGLAVALRQSLQRLADSLPFSSGVTEVSLGAFMRGDENAAASIQETLRERQELAAAATPELGIKSERGSGEGSKERGRGGVVSASKSKSKSKPNENTRSGGATPRAVAGRTKIDCPGTPGGAPSTPARRKGVRTPRPGSTATTPSRSARSPPVHSRETSGKTGARGTGPERQNAGAVERQKSATAERTRKPTGSRASPALTPSSGSSSSLQRTSSKSSVRVPGSSAGKSSTSERSSRQQQQHRTTPATLASRDRMAAAQPTPPRRMHQGEELDSIDGFSPIVPTHAPSPGPSPSRVSLQRSSSSRRARGNNTTPSPGTGTLSRSGSVSSMRNGSGGGGGGALRGGGAQLSARPEEAPVVSEVGEGEGEGEEESSLVVDSIAEVVSQVMGDTAAVAGDRDSLPSVAPSTWNWGRDGVASSSAADEPSARKGTGKSGGSSSSSGDANGGAMGDEEDSSSTGEGGEERATLLRKSSSSSDSSVFSIPESGEEPGLSSGLAALALNDGTSPRSDARSEETTALEISSSRGGAGGQQLVTLANASRMIAPIVAQEVEKETKKIEIRMKNEMNAALRTVRAEMEAIDREGLMARVAMEKRLKTSIKRLLHRIEHLDRRFTRMEREDRRLALQASSASSSSAPAIEASSGGVGVGAPPALTDDTGVDTGGDLPSPSSESNGGRVLTNKSARTGAMLGDGCYKDAAIFPEGTQAATDALESRPFVLKRAWGSGLGGQGGGSVFSAVSSTVPSDEEFSESGDDTESDIVRMLEEKMAALEGKLLGHEERQRADHRVREALPMSSSAAVMA